MRIWVREIAVSGASYILTMLYVYLVNAMCRHILTCLRCLHRFCVKISQWISPVILSPSKLVQSRFLYSLFSIKFHHMMPLSTSSSCLVCIASLDDYQEYPINSHFTKLHLVMVSKNQAKIKAHHTRKWSPDELKLHLRFWVV